MSYILDALRRADAERQRGQAPGRQQVTHEALAPPAARQATAGCIVALVLLAGGAGTAAWWWLQPRQPAPVAAVPAAPVAVRPSVAPSAPRVSAAAPPVRAPAPPAAPPVVRVTPAPAPRASPAAPPPRPPASAATPRPVLASALPEPLRSAVLRLQVGGVVHSQDRSQSFVMVGGQIAHEGDTLAPGITLERIGPRALLLRVAEQAVELPL